MASVCARGFGLIVSWEGCSSHQLKVYPSSSLAISVFVTVECKAVHTVFLCVEGLVGLAQQTFEQKNKPHELIPSYMGRLLSECKPSSFNGRRVC